MANDNATPAGEVLLQRKVDPRGDRIRGGTAGSGVVNIVVYSDYLCPYCRRLRQVIARLRQAMGERLAYVFRHYPNERAHPGAEFMSRAAEAAGAQGKFWEMHDLLYGHALPLKDKDAVHLAQRLGIDMERFHRDIESEETKRRVA